MKIFTFTLFKRVKKCEFCCFSRPLGGAELMYTKGSYLAILICLVPKELNSNDNL